MHLSTQHIVDSGLCFRIIWKVSLLSLRAKVMEISGAHHFEFQTRDLCLNVRGLFHYDFGRLQDFILSLEDSYLPQMRPRCLLLFCLQVGNISFDGIVWIHEHIELLVLKANLLGVRMIGVSVSILFVFVKCICIVSHLPLSACV